MRVRKQDENGDMMFGHSLADFWIDVPDAPGQVVGTRLRLWLGQWFLKTDDGTAYQTKVLGKYTGSTRDIEIQTRILTTPEVSGLEGYNSSLNVDTREFDINASVDTTYGQFILRGPF